MVGDFDCFNYGVWKFVFLLRGERFERFFRFFKASFFVVVCVVKFEVFFVCVGEFEIIEFS